MIDIDALQAFIFEALDIFGPTFAAVVAGFAVFYAGTLYITPAGERYLDRTCG